MVPYVTPDHHRGFLEDNAPCVAVACAATREALLALRRDASYTPRAETLWRETAHCREDDHRSVPPHTRSAGAHLWGGVCWSSPVMRMPYETAWHHPWRQGAGAATGGPARA